MMACILFTFKKFKNKVRNAQLNKINHLAADLSILGDFQNEFRLFEYSLMVFVAVVVIYDHVKSA